MQTAVVWKLLFSVRWYATSFHRVIVDRFLKYLRVLNPLILLACGAFVGEANPYFEFCYSVLQTPSNVSTNS